MTANKPLKLVIFSLLSVSSLYLSSCASRHQPFTEAQEAANPYLQRAQSEKSSKLAAELAQNSYRLLRGSNPVFVAEVKKELESNAWLGTLPQGWIHADAHVLQPVRLNKNWGWSDWDTFTLGWYWFDLLHAEVSTQAFHKSGGFRSTYDFSCYESYVKSFLRESAPLPQPSFDKEAVESFAANTQEDFGKHGAWTKSPELSEENRPLIGAFLSDTSVKEQAGPQLFTSLSQAPIRELESGIGSFNNAKFLFLTGDNQLYELKEVGLPPAEKLLHASTAQESSGTYQAAHPCQRYETLRSTFGNASFLHTLPLACFSHNQRVFTLLKWTLDYKSLDVDDFADWSAAKSYVEWSCGSLALFHKHGMSELQQRKWALSLASPAPFQIQLKKLSRKLFEQLDEGHRMWALEQNIE